jgi:hypothetical protein
VIGDIFIPTRGRAGDVRTLWDLPAKWRERCYLVVRPDEYSDYHTAQRHDQPIGGIVKLPKGIEGISATRQWILENAEGKALVMLDDDLTGINIKQDHTVFGGVARARNQSLAWDAVLRLMDRWLEQGEAHVSFTDRVSSARPSTRWWYENGRTSQTLFYNLRIVRGIGARFDRVPLSQDLDMNLQILEAGFTNRVSLKYSFNAKPEDAKGGCSTFRTDTVKEQVCRTMEFLHPGICTYKTKPKYGRTYHYLTTNWRAFR